MEVKKKPANKPGQMKYLAELGKRTDTAKKSRAQLLAERVERKQTIAIQPQAQPEEPQLARKKAA
jgi:hypothetical protein